MNQFLAKKRHPEDGYELWLRYAPITDSSTRAAYQQVLQQMVIHATSPTLQAAQEELALALENMLGEPVPFVESVTQANTLVIGTPHSSSEIAALDLQPLLAQVGEEGFVITRMAVQSQDCIVITANTDLGVLYGVFHFLQHLQMQRSLDDLHIISAPKIKLRMLNHWDNLDRTVERGYAGFSLWDWHNLPDYLDPRYKDYARANASIGINGVTVTNVNANALVLTPQYLRKVAALADVFRPYGIRVFLTARFSAPMEIGGLETADPLATEVAEWWAAKVSEIYDYIPDFGGFLVKANSEGQPGPHDYGRSHAEGANLLARPLVAHGGVVIWRAFVYDEDVPEDRAKQAYNDLVPQDGTFLENVLLQVKNGPIDFQPREPYHPLFGAMPKTPLMLEVQVTQEYLGLATNLVYLAPLFKETLDADTYCDGPGSTVARVVDGTLDDNALSGMAGVSNIGTDRNWCGHPFAAANWYALGRLAWDHQLSSESIAEEWLRMTFSNDDHFVEAATALMIESREAVVDYMTPLGLHHIMARDHHYGPGPWVDEGRPDWTSVYYHRADQEGIGFDRTASGSNAVSQYHSPYREQLADLDTCPEELLLWFHHVPWQHTMKSGRTLWDELCDRYNQGVESVRRMQQTWASLAAYVDEARFVHVQSLLRIQEQEACWWRDACLLYFQTFSQLPIPPQYEQPAQTLDYYINLRHYYVPGIRERRFG
ncbi:MAG: alpha-glucuronidase [Anaerolineae bacterium]|nr:alpha-glucuronidase [Anaerolineae bacterium]